MPTTEMRTHASTTMPLSSTWSITSMTLELLGVRSSMACSPRSRWQHQPLLPIVRHHQTEDIQPIVKSLEKLFTHHEWEHGTLGDRNRLDIYGVAVQPGEESFLLREVESIDSENYQRAHGFLRRLHCSPWMPFHQRRAQMRAKPCHRCTDSSFRTDEE